MRELRRAGCKAGGHQPPVPTLGSPGPRWPAIFGRAESNVILF